MAESSDHTPDDEGAAPVPTRAEARAILTAPGAPFEMEEIVVRGIPLRAWKTAPASLRAVFEQSILHGDKTFLVYEDERVTFDECFRTVATLGRQLVERFGVQPGDRVAIVMRNLPEWVMAFWATITVGAIAVPLNAWWTGEELAYGLADSGTKVAFVDEERQGRISHHLADIPGLEAMIVTCEEHDPDSGGRRPAVGCLLDRVGNKPLPVVPFAEALGPVADDATLVDVSVDSDDDATMTLTGTVARTSTEPRPVPVNDPPLFLGRVLADRIVRAGMPAPASMAVVAPADKPAAAKAVAATVTPLACNCDRIDLWISRFLR